jgi:hypothetical protein
MSCLKEIILRLDKAFEGSTHSDVEWDVVISAPDYLSVIRPALLDALVTEVCFIIKQEKENGNNIPETPPVREVWES